MTKKREKLGPDRHDIPKEHVKFCGGFYWTVDGLWAALGSGAEPKVYPTGQSAWEQDHQEQRRAANGPPYMPWLLFAMDLDYWKREDDKVRSGEKPVPTIPENGQLTTIED